MKNAEIMELFTKSGAYKQGHFKLSSGLHSGSYLQCALVLQDPVLASRLCGVLAQKFENDKPDIVIGPALGGVVFAYEMARVLGAKAMFTERDDEGKMRLRRGFIITPSSKVLVAEDVLTTGRSVREVMEVLEEDGVKPTAIACMVDRTTVKPDFGGIRYESLIKLTIPAFNEEKCPLCKEGLPLVKPGSRRETKGNSKQ